MPLPIIQTVLLIITVSQIGNALHEQQQQQQSTDSCDLEITSKMDKSGTITSPNYPNQYPANLRCSYRFRSQNAERVQLVFTDFDLYQPPDHENSLCRGEFDHFSAYVDLDGRMSEVDTFCGVEMPPQLMSSQNLIAAEFVTHQYIVQPKRPYRDLSQILESNLVAVIPVIDRKKKRLLKMDFKVQIKYFRWSYKRDVHNDRKKQNMN
ncbi:putative CUB domain protein [Trichinella spiralis]|uniref:putative CUB domain protein n=1 Tax=Trichinella spiralis TaxID=6334 RepID=UPI0001EFDDE8|nr:putative CUB domain protein [Trichinella spiralis]